MGWDEKIAVTNDLPILKYLLSKGEKIPAFPAAGDRPACFLDPATVRVGVVNAGGPAAGLCTVNDSLTKRHFLLAGNLKPVIFGYRGGFAGVAPGPAGATTKFRLVPAERQKAAILTGVGVAPGDVMASEYILVTDDYSLDAVTFLKTSRFDLRNPKNMQQVVAGIIQDQLDILYVVGGNGSQAAAQRIKTALNEINYKGQRGYKGPQGQPLVVVGGPKTMDNDLLFADCTFGFQTTVDHLVDAIGVFHNTVDSQDRVGVMQVFGAASGFVALNGAYCSGEVDYSIVPEVVERAGIQALAPDEITARRVIEEARFVGAEQALRSVGLTREEVFLAGILIVMQHAGDQIATRYNDKRHALVVVAEGAKGMFGHSGTGSDLMPFSEIVGRLKAHLNSRTSQPYGSVNVTPIEPTYLIRDNPPRSFDIALCKFIGKAMADTALAGYTDCLVTRWCGRYVLVPLELSTALVNMIDPTDYFYRSMATRYKTALNQPYVDSTWESCREEYHQRYTQRLEQQLLAGTTHLFADIQDEEKRDDATKYVAAALELAKRGHDGATRKHGGPYIDHPLRVAISVMQQMKNVRINLSGHPIAAALLHDVIEDASGKVKKEDIVADCGQCTLDLVIALTGQSKTEIPDEEHRSRAKANLAEQAGDVACRIKLADRIDNLTDACRLPLGPEAKTFRERYYRLTNLHFVPMAERLGDQELLKSLTQAVSLLGDSHD